MTSACLPRRRGRLPVGSAVRLIAGLDLVPCVAVGGGRRVGLHVAHARRVAARCCRVPRRRLGRPQRAADVNHERDGRGPGTRCGPGRPSRRSHHKRAKPARVTRWRASARRGVRASYTSSAPVASTAAASTPATTTIPCRLRWSPRCVAVADGHRQLHRSRVTRCVFGRTGDEVGGGRDEFEPGDHGKGDPRGRRVPAPAGSRLSEHGLDQVRHVRCGPQAHGAAGRFESGPPTTATVAAVEVPVGGKVLGRRRFAVETGREQLANVIAFHNSRVLSTASVVPSGLKRRPNVLLGADGTSWPGQVTLVAWKPKIRSNPVPAVGPCDKLTRACRPHCRGAPC